MGDPVIGTEVDGYRIQEVLGKGGMGTVYKAEDVNLSRPVALKRINPSQAHRDMFIHRFRSEAKALARIDSRHITGVYALRETDIGLLIVMEYVEGGTLKDVIERHDGPVPLDEAIPLFEQILQAFDDAHSAGVIHRDIKPQNIMLSTEGMVKVTDFGIAKLRRPDSGETVTQGGKGGTLKYMSPEQVSSIDDVDDRSDLYSIGMTAYEMMAGQLPFESPTTDFDIMQRVVEGRIPPPNRYHDGLPPSIVQWIQKATAKAQKDRYQSAEEMLTALRAAKTEADVTAENPDWDDQGVTMTAVDTPERNTIQPSTPQTDVPETSGGDTVMADDVESAFEGETVLEGTTPDPQTAPKHPTDASANTAPSGESTETATPTSASDRAASRRSSSRDAKKSGTTSSSAGATTLIAGLVAVVLLGGGGYWFLAGGSSGGTGGAASLTLSTTPANATVYVNEETAGTTPLTDYALPAGAVALRIEKPGYQPVDTVLQDVSRGQTLVLDGMDLAPQPGRLTVTSTPTGAEVYVDGRSVGTTPVTGVSAEPGTRQVRLEKDGASAERTVDLRPGETVTWTGATLSAGSATAGARRDRSDRAATREPQATSESPTSRSTAESSSSAASEPATGVLQVGDVTSGAAVYVDGERRGASGSYTVRAGRRDVTCRHPDFGRIQQTMTVREGASQTVNCHFRQKVSVPARGPWSNVIINGTNTGKSTPASFMLPPGQHEIRLSLERSKSMRVTDGAYKLTVDGEDADMQTFSGNSYTINVEPGFAPRHYVVSFKVEM